MSNVGRDYTWSVAMVLKKVTECLNHGMVEWVLLEIFYRTLDEVNQGVVNNMEKGSFLNISYPQATVSHDQIAKINMAWYTHYWVKGGSVVTSTLTNEMRKKEDEPDEKMAKMITSFYILAKHIMVIVTKSVNSTRAYIKLYLKPRVLMPCWRRHYVLGKHRVRFSISVSRGQPRSLTSLGRESWLERAILSIQRSGNKIKWTRQARGDDRYRVPNQMCLPKELILPKLKLVRLTLSIPIFRRCLVVF